MKLLSESVDRDEKKKQTKKKNKKKKKQKKKKKNKQTNKKKKKKEKTGGFSLTLSLRKIQELALSFVLMQVDVNIR